MVGEHAKWYNSLDIYKCIFLSQDPGDAMQPWEFHHVVLIEGSMKTVVFILFMSKPDDQSRTSKS